MCAMRKEKNIKEILEIAARNPKGELFLLHWRKEVCFHIIMLQQLTLLFYNIKGVPVLFSRRIGCTIKSCDLKWTIQEYYVGVYSSTICYFKKEMHYLYSIVIMGIVLQLQ